MWLGVLGLLVGVIGAWDKLCAVVIRLMMLPIALSRMIVKIITCPDPLSIQLAAGLDNFGYRLGYSRFSEDPLSYPRLFTASRVPLTTWLRHPAWGLDSYRRHLQALRENEDLLRTRIGVCGT